MTKPTPITPFKKQPRFYIWNRNFIRSKYGPQTFRTIARFLVMRGGKWTPVQAA